MAEADFLSTTSVIPQSLPVRELGPHSQLCPGLTERARDIDKHKERERVRERKRIKKERERETVLTIAGMERRKEEG